MPIQILSSEVVDQIAAGEVVERPAHMVKELIENSLDAGATEIDIDFDHGGRYVRVHDNGGGISQAEIPLAVARHATSKISRASDLWNLVSYGFRGEALATISAVSKLQLTSRQKNKDLAHSILVEFGHANEVVEMGGELGTTVTVSDLFSNIPARLKFLKTDAAESSQIKNTVKAMALASPKVGFRLRQAGKLLFYFSPSSLQGRAEQVLDVGSLYSGECEEQGFKVQVALAPPHQVERSSRQIWIFVQGRWVNDRALQAAVMDAYRSLLMHGEYPVAAIWLECPPAEVDVNIHPAKSAVKFQNSSLAYRTVHRVVRQVLEAAPWREQLGQAPSDSVRAQPSATENMAFADQGLERIQYRQHTPTQLETWARLAPTIARAPRAPRVAYEGSSLEVKGPPDNPSSVSAEENLSLSSKVWSRLQVLGQAHQTYILAQSEKSLILIDQHAAHERVSFERLKRAWQGGWIDVQTYLLPLKVEIEPQALELMKESFGEFEKLGIHMELGGPDHLLVRASPQLLPEKALVESLKLLAQEMESAGGSFALEKSVDHVIATMACHGSVRAGQALSMEQMTSLLEQMDEFPLSGYCPHGRPVSIELPFAKIERDFGRQV